MWHGPALTDVLDGVQHDRAAAKPIATAHSIWEIVLHVTAWADIARLRLAGQATGDPTAEQDWPPVPAPVPGSDPQVGSDPASDPASDPHFGSDAASDPASDPTADPQFASDPASSDPASAWRLAVERLGESHRQLAAAARKLDDEKLNALVPGLEYSVSVLLHGIVEHGTYHGGQIALLRRASGGALREPSGQASSAPTT